MIIEHSVIEIVIVLLMYFVMYVLIKRMFKYTKLYFKYLNSPCLVWKQTEFGLWETSNRLYRVSMTGNNTEHEAYILEENGCIEKTLGVFDNADLAKDECNIHFDELNQRKVVKNV